MRQPTDVVSVVSFLPDAAVIGVGMPIIYRLTRPIVQKHRAALHRRLLVQTEPAQGVWTWYTATELHWAPRDFWRAGTKISVVVRVGGRPLGDGRYGKRDSTLQCSVGPARTMSIDDAASPKVMLVKIGDAVVRRIPVGLGRPACRRRAGRPWSSRSW